MNIVSVIADLTSFGAAGLMGTMWLWERKLNRHRDEQLNASHERILRDEQRLRCLTEVVEKNTAAIVRSAQQQKEELGLLRHVLEELHHGRLS